MIAQKHILNIKFLPDSMLNKPQDQWWLSQTTLSLCLHPKQ